MNNTQTITDKCTGQYTGRIVVIRHLARAAAGRRRRVASPVSICSAATLTTRPRVGLTWSLVRYLSTSDRSLPNSCAACRSDSLCVSGVYNSVQAAVTHCVHSALGGHTTNGRSLDPIDHPYSASQHGQHDQRTGCVCCLPTLKTLPAGVHH